MSFRHTSFHRLSQDLLPPIMAGLISVIVNYGGTFILIFQAAQMAGLSPELTASWISPRGG
jgi:benzoate membrane transport protein